MLFSNHEVARFIDTTFEPVWVSVRPAPLVTIDFGNDRKVVRTLQGNVATYVCDAEGTVHDVLPGIYTPRPYQEQLALLAALVKDFAPILRFRTDGAIEGVSRQTSRGIESSGPPAGRGRGADRWNG